MIPLLPAATRIACRGSPERRRPHKRPGVATSKPDNLVQDATQFSRRPRRLREELR
jgi:hypothetical protein